MKVAALQMRSEAFEPNLNRARGLERIAEAAVEGVRIVVLPELTIPGYVLDAEGLGAVAEPLFGPTFGAWRAIAARENLVVAGGFCEREGDRLYNSAILVGPDGLLLHYRKLHLFDREKTIFAPGNKGLAVADTPFGRIGLCVCYDLRFVEVLRALALQGAELAAVPTAWVAGFDRNPRDAAGLIGQVRGASAQANLDQIYVACASQAGTTRDVHFLGSSMIADPFGEIQAGPLGDDEERTLVAGFDPAVVRAAQQRAPLIQPRADRRTDVYGLRLGSAML